VTDHGSLSGDGLDVIVKEDELWLEVDVEGDGHVGWRVLCYVDASFAEAIIEPHAGLGDLRRYNGDDLQNAGADTTDAGSIALVAVALYRGAADLHACALTGPQHVSTKV